MRPKFSLIVPTTGNKRKLHKLLSSLTHLEMIDQSEIILVLNPASDRLRGLVDEFPQLKLKILFSQAGVNCARNQGMAEATGEYLMFLDDDCWILDAYFLVRQEQHHIKNPWAFAVGGFYQSEVSSPLVKEYGEIQRLWLLNNQISKTGECLTLLGGNFSMQNSSENPKFDESIRYGGAETEYFFRLKTQGHRYLLTDQIVHHEPQLNLFSFLRKAFLQGKTHQRLIKNQVFQHSSWVTLHQPAHWMTIYSVVFHRSWLKIFRAPINRIKFFLKRLHHDFWFYLSNRNNFSVVAKKQRHQP